MNNSTHISLKTLANIAEHGVKDAAGEIAMAHIAVCASCDDTLRRLQHLIHLMKSDTSKDAPRDVLFSAINIFSTQKRLPFRRIVATLIFDSRSAGPAFGMRSVHTASRQLVYSAEQADLDLRIAVQNGECVIAGQVIGDTCAGGLVEISGANGSATASLNESCEFTLPTIPIGNYLLRVRLPDVEIEIPELELTD